MSGSLGIIVVTYNSRDLLPALIESLPAGCAGLSWQLVVVDNDSSDDSVAEAARLAPEATIVPMGRNGGYSTGINAGLAAAGDRDAYLVLNPDVRLEPGCAATLVQAVGQPGVGIAVPRLLDARGELILSMRREPSLGRALGDLVLGAERAGRFAPLGEMVMDPRLYARRRATDWAEGSTQLFSRECLAAVGGWDESYFLYSEETDFNLRARDAGYRTLFVPEAGATHLEGGSAASPRMWPLVQTNRVRLFRRRHRVVPSALFWLLTVLREATRAMLGRQTSRRALHRLLSPSAMRETPGPWSVGGRS